MPEVTDDIFSSGLITLKDRIAITTLLASILIDLDFLTEAKKLLIRAKDKFDGTIEQIDILKFLSKIAIRNNDFNNAIEIMESIPSVSLW